MDWIFLGIIIVSLILLIGLGYITFVLFFNHNYGNEVLDLLQHYQNWQWVNPVAVDQKRNIPYSFQIIPENQQLRVSYYDDAGYLKGFSTFITSYTIVDSNTLRLEHVETLQNYSQIKPVFPWTLKYIDKNHLLAQISGVSKVLELL